MVHAGEQPGPRLDVCVCARLDAGGLPAFNVASTRSSERAYIDLMAGQPENRDAATGELLSAPCGSSSLSDRLEVRSSGFGFGASVNSTEDIGELVRHRRHGQMR